MNSYSFHRDNDGLVCKINISTNPMDNAVAIQFSPFHMQEDELIKIWGHKITNLLVCVK